MARVAAVDAPPPPPEEICDDKEDNDGDGQTNEGCEPPPPPPGPGCSPGYWKNHESDFLRVCPAAAASSDADAFDSCDELLTAITCKGSQPGCTGARRQAAAALLNTNQAVRNLTDLTSGTHRHSRSVFSPAGKFLTVRAPSDVPRRPSSVVVSLIVCADPSLFPCRRPSQPQTPGRTHRRRGR